MAINFRCRCGEALEVDDEYAGMQVQCPSCQEVVTATRPTVTRVTRVAAVRPIAPPPVRESAPRPRDEEDERPKRSRVLDDDEEPTEDRPRRRRVAVDEDGERPRRKKRPKEEPQHHSFEGRVFSGSVMGGLGAMGLGLLLFFGPLAFGWFFPYSAILFIIGLIGFIRGLLKSGDE